MAFPDGSRRVIGPALAAASIVAVGISGPALGQQSTNMPPGANSGVTVDLGVLDELGPTVSRPMAPKGAAPLRATPPAEPRGKIRLTPPPARPKLTPDGRSVGVPAKAPGPKVHRAPPPVPRTKPRPPVLAATRPPPVVRAAPAAPKAPEKPITVARPPKKPAPAPAKQAQPKAPDSVKVAAAATPEPPKPGRIETRSDRDKSTEMLTATPPEPPKNPRLAAAIDAPMSLLRPPEPKPAPKTDTEPTVPVGRGSDMKTPTAPTPAPAQSNGPKPAVGNVTATTSDKEPQATEATEQDATAPDAARSVPTSSAPAGRQQAALRPAPAETLGPGSTVRVAFAADLTTLSQSAAAQVEQVASRLKSNNRLRLQLMAYADGASRSTSAARRMSLYRALAVRSHLIKTGVRSTRIDVRALGHKFGKGPPDRVDLVVFAR